MRGICGSSFLYKCRVASSLQDGQAHSNFCEPCWKAVCRSCLRVVGSRFIREIVLHDFFFFSFRRSRESDSEMAINIKRELPGLWASVSWISASTVRSPQGTTGTEDWKMDWFASCSPAEGPWSVLPSSFPSRHRKLLLSRCCSCFLVTPPSHSCGRLNHETEQKRKCYSYEMN